ncbi:hypothetical protein DL95DRAFT_416431 [Leptodontidium sp. 2 PMI_412]|nr:hypothetical protein DL95DRAFT_416431 [Leptodontidium sp. 2 PMI_412]
MKKATIKSARKVRHRVGGGSTWPGKGIGIGHRRIIPSQSIRPAPYDIFTDLSATARRIKNKSKPRSDTVASLRKLSLSNTKREVEAGSPQTRKEKILADQLKGEGAEEEFSELDRRMAAELANHAGRKNVRLEDLKLARTMAGLLGRPLF